MIATALHPDAQSAFVSSPESAPRSATPAVLYRTVIEHGRTEQITHGFRYRHVMWLVDVDALPQLPRGLRWLATFAARDHLGDPARTIRANVDGYLAEQGVDLERGRVLMLTNARSLGYTFNPLTVFWCYGPDDTLRCIVAEVHNTYGERHCYLLRPDPDGRAETAKEFYVSPFFAVDGSYEMQFSAPGDELDVAITLRRGPDRRPVFRATLTGRRDPAADGSVLGAALRHPFAGRRVMALIKFQGLRLWLRRLPLVARPPRPNPAAPVTNHNGGHP